jgi:hypothetical protein
MEEDLNLRTSRMGPVGQDALRAVLDETRIVLARAQRRNERGEEQLAAFSRQVTALWVALLVLAGGFVLLAVYVVLILK